MLIVRKIEEDKLKNEDNVSEPTYFLEEPADVNLVDPHPSQRHSLIRRAEVRSPLSSSLFGALLFLLFPLIMIFSLLLPWQQSAIGVGEVSSYNPHNRPQKIEAPVDGIVVEWLVSEGDRVKAGDVLIRLQDNDPQQLERLTMGALLGENQLETVKQKKLRYEEKYRIEQSALEQKTEEIRQKIRALEDKWRGINAELLTEEIQAERYSLLFKEGIVSKRELELAVLKRDKSLASKEALESEIGGTKNQLSRVQLEGEAKLTGIMGSIDEIDVKLAELEQKQLQLQSKVVKQQTQDIKAPMDGIVYKFANGTQGEQVKKGDYLLRFVPDSNDRVVALEVDGNDLALMHEGQEVRLVFEGWPALQFVGFPGADAGTYAGVIQRISPTNSDKGGFHIWVSPSTSEDEEAWPSSDRLRQGLQVKGWVMLGTVPLGYEIWRQINGFPPKPSIEKGEKQAIPSSKKPKSNMGSP